MKKRKLIVGRILSAIFTVLGFASCSGINGEQQDEYGCPITKFQVKGTVTSETGEALKGVQVIIKGDEGMYFTKSSADTVYTDSKGEYISDEGSTIALEKASELQNAIYTQRVIFKDKTNVYQSDSSAFVGLPKEQVEKGKGWYSGKFILKADKKLKKN